MCHISTAQGLNLNKFIILNKQLHSILTVFNSTFSYYSSFSMLMTWYLVKCLRLPGASCQGHPFVIIEVVVVVLPPLVVVHLGTGEWTSCCSQQCCLTSLKISRFLWFEFFSYAVKPKKSKVKNNQIVSVPEIAQYWPGQQTKYANISIKLIFHTVVGKVKIFHSKIVSVWLPNDSFYFQKVMFFKIAPKVPKIFDYFFMKIGCQ